MLLLPGELEKVGIKNVSNCLEPGPELQGGSSICADMIKVTLVGIL